MTANLPNEPPGPVPVDRDSPPPDEATAEAKPKTAK